MSRTFLQPPGRPPSHRHPRLGLLCIATTLGIAGCQPRTTRIRIQDFSHPDGPRSLFQEFDDAYYQLDAAGDLNLLLRRRSPSEAIPTEHITQTILVRSYWRPIPGTTRVESSMINAKITYVIQSGRATRVYEGNGFVSFSEHQKGQSLSGRIESGQLRPTGEIGDPPHPFGRARIEGTFRAIRKPRRGTAILTDIKCLLQSMKPVDE
ncbi:MAG: hypothetical protein JSU68_06150 [Phycisphaerales bacterium]|nr:MAG: hypothetical protein JSU68_06150 [Phycisphaerales bacterium]